MVLFVYHSEIRLWLAQLLCLDWLTHYKFGRTWRQRARLLPEKGVEIFFLAYVLHI